MICELWAIEVFFLSEGPPGKYFIKEFQRATNFSATYFLALLADLNGDQTISL
jgi:hypothetical protein